MTIMDDGRDTTQPSLDDLAAASNVSVPGLRVGRHLTLQQRYLEWRASEDGRVIFDEVRYRANQLWIAGWRHFGIASIWEAIRYDRAVRVGPNAGFKLNNDFRSRMAREVMAAYPHLQGFFETRELKA